MKEIREILDLVTNPQVINEYGLDDIRLRCFTYYDYVLVKNTNFMIYPDKQIEHNYFEHFIKGFENGVWYFSYFLLISGEKISELKKLIIDKFGDIIEEPEFRQMFDSTIILQVSFNRKVNKTSYL